MTPFEADIVAAPTAISALTEQVMDFLRHGGVDGRTTHHIAMVLDELLANVAMHGGGPEVRASVRVEIRPDRVAAEVIDQGVAFDPRDASPPDTTLPLEDRPIGGMGLFLTRQVTSEFHYERTDNRNRTSFSVIRQGTAS